LSGESGEYQDKEDDEDEEDDEGTGDKRDLTGHRPRSDVTEEDLETTEGEEVDLLLTLLELTDLEMEDKENVALD
jgi:hypothetical protein